MKQYDSSFEAAERSPVLLPAQTPAPVPFTFGPVERPLFGWYHPPRPGAARSTAIVLCKPIGYEAICTHAAYRYLAERLAEAGYPALRFDYDGTGNSEGSDEDEDRVRSWIGSIGFAIDTLRQRTGSPHAVLFGVRLGATLATAAAAERGDVSGLILWAACRNGRSYLRETRILRASRRQGVPAPAPRDTPTYEEAAGFLLSRQTISELNGLDASAVTRRPAPEALLISRDNVPDDARLGEHLRELGTGVTRVSWPGYAAMMRDAQDTEVPRAAIESIIAWLDTRSASAGFCLPTPAPRPSETRLVSESYTEEPLIGLSRPESFGILTRPCGSDRGTAVLLLTVGANPHIGPNRMYVALARRLARSGFFVLRLDVPGVGDSARGDTPARGQIYSDAAIAEVRAAVSGLAARLGIDRFALVGLCSGAYTAYKLTTSDPRVSSQVLINPQTFEWRDGDSLDVIMSGSYKLSRVYFTSLYKWDTWTRLGRGQVDARGIARVLCKRMLSRGGAALKSVAALAIRRESLETQVCRDFRRIGDRGVGTLLVFAAEDAGIEVMASHLGPNARKLRGGKRVHLEIISGADHTFTEKVPRDHMLSSVVEYLCRFYPGD